MHSGVTAAGCPNGKTLLILCFLSELRMLEAPHYSVSTTFAAGTVCIVYLYCSPNLYSLESDQQHSRHLHFPALVE